MADVDSIKYRAKNDVAMAGFRTKYEAIDSGTLSMVASNCMAKSGSAQGRMVLSSNPDNDAYEAFYFLAEAEVINEITKARNEEKKKSESAKNKWKEWKQEQIDNKVLKLKYSASANGQLIASILEDEDGKNEQEIAGWCDELAVLEQKDFREMIEGLVQEGTLKKEKGKYWLQQIFDGNVKAFNDYPVEYIKEHLTPCDSSDDPYKMFRMILQLIRLQETVTLYDILEVCVYQDEKYYKETTADFYEIRFDEKMESKCFLGSSVEISKGLGDSGQRRMAQFYLEKLLKDGVIEQTKVEGMDIYFFARSK